MAAMRPRRPSGHAGSRGAFPGVVQQDNTATFPGKLREFIPALQCDREYPQSSCDKQLDAIVAAARSIQGVS